jgi:hypothetical protein
MQRKFYCKVNKLKITPYEKGVKLCELWQREAAQLVRWGNKGYVLTMQTSKALDRLECLECKGKYAEEIWED